MTDSTTTTHLSGTGPLLLARGMLASAVVIAAVTAAALLIPLNPAGAGFVLLAGVLLIAARQPLFVATVTALLATLSFNFFFIPPTHTLNIEDPENWIALATFLLTSLVANRLLMRERSQAESAQLHRQEVEALYAMSISLLKRGGTGQVAESMQSFLDGIGAASGGVISFGSSPQHQRVAAWSGAPMSDEVEDIAAGVARHRRTADLPSRFGRDICVPVTIAGRVRAAFIVRGTLRTSAVVESAANLLSFAIERDEFMDERAHIAALREASEMKTSLLQAVSHDLKSPLTVLAVESEALQRMGGLTAAATEHVRVLRDEVSRLHRRVENLLSVARFEAGIVTPRSEPTPPADLFRAARESLPTVTGRWSIRTTVSEDARDLLVDPSLALEIVINLIENAANASPEGGVIELSASPSADAADRVHLEVRDRGAGLPPSESMRLKSAERDVRRAGLGIELARTMALLSGGTVEWFPRDGGGTVARLDLPAAPLPSGETA